MELSWFIFSSGKESVLHIAALTVLGGTLTGGLNVQLPSQAPGFGVRSAGKIVDSSRPILSQLYTKLVDEILEFVDELW